MIKCTLHDNQYMKCNFLTMYNGYAHSYMYVNPNCM